MNAALNLRVHSPVNWSSGFWRICSVLYMVLRLFMGAIIFLNSVRGSNPGPGTNFSLEFKKSNFLDRIWNRHMSTYIKIKEFAIYKHIISSFADKSNSRKNKSDMDKVWCSALLNFVEHKQAFISIRKQHSSFKAWKWAGKWRRCFRKKKVPQHQ